MVWLFVLAAAGVFGVFLIQASGFDIETATGPEPAAPVVATKQSSEQERFAVQGSEVAGFDDDQQPYKIAAVEANQDKEQPNLVHMRQVTGLLRRTDGRAMDVTAKTGLFDSKNKSLRLSGDVSIKLADTFTASMDTADIDVKQKALTSQDEIVVVMDGGVIRSTGVDVTNNGEHVTFKARVRAIFNSAATQDSPPAAPVETSSSKGNL
ncbi:MAG: LPS export ABC transporter periplasmic protein LptC, partial [Pseudomonadota bacterium]